MTSWNCRALGALYLGLLAASAFPIAHGHGLAGEPGKTPPAAAATPSPAALDLRGPMELAAEAIVRRLDPAKDYRPWFLLRGAGGIPSAPEHDSWDLGDMTGRYLEGLILARRMGLSRPDFSEAEGRLQKYLLKLLGPDGLVHHPETGAVDHSFSQGSALYGLVLWFEDSGDPAVRLAAQRLVSGLLRRLEDRGGRLVDPTTKLAESSGSHLTGYQIYPAIRFYEQTGFPDALKLAEALTRWAIEDPVLGADGAITKPLSWEGHVHSWLDTLAGCVRTARHGQALDRPKVVARARAVYDWVRRTNATSFGWIATYPTGGSCETCAISSAIRLALELAQSGFPEYLDDVDRFVRNQVVEAQFRNLEAYRGGPRPPTPLLIGCFDSQSMPNCHLGTRGGEDVGTVEGCCLNGGMRAIALAWDAAQTFDEGGVTVNFGLSRDGPAARVIGHEPREGRIDVIPRAAGLVRVRLPRWVESRQASVLLDGKPVPLVLEKGCVEVASAAAMARVSVRFPLGEREEDVVAGGKKFHVRWKGNTVIAVSPSEGREPTYQNRLKPAQAASRPLVPDTYAIQDAARLARSSMLARIDLERGGQPFFRVYPFAAPPRAEHEKWDDGDMTGRYVESLILVRRMTGVPMDPRERVLRSYLAGLFDPADGLCYTRAASWTPRRACLFSQSCAMLGLLAWHRETGSAEARRLLDRHVDGLMRIAVDRGNSACFPKYEWDGKRFVDDPQGRDAPAWYGGRLVLPLVEYWRLSGRADVKTFLERLIRYSTEISPSVKPDGEVVGIGWWGHLHGTMDMAAGVADYGRIAGRPEKVAWAQRVYEWIGRNRTTRYGWVADATGSPICESCAIASRIRLGLALYRAGAADPFGEIDRHLRNQLCENQFRDLAFLGPLEPTRPRTDRATYAGIDRMILGTFQCWGTANDLIGHDDIEGCGAGGGVIGLAQALDAGHEWRDRPDGKELRIHLLFNRRLRAAEAPLTSGGPIAAEVWSHLPQEGRAAVVAHRPLARLAMRLPDGSPPGEARVQRSAPAGSTVEAKSVSQAPSAPAHREGPYVVVDGVAAGERIEVTFPLDQYETVEIAHGTKYRVQWKGSSVVSLDPPGRRVPLYRDRPRELRRPTPLSSPRYP